MEAPFAAAPFFDTAGNITADTSCRRCSYNLRGLRNDGRCPECGTPVGLSTQGNLLRFADPAWVDKLARGIRFMLWGLAAAMLCGFVSGFAGAVFNMPALIAVGGLVGSLLAVYGSWLLTDPDPSGVGEDKTVNARKTIRFCLLLGLFGSVLNIPLQTGGLPRAMMVVIMILIGIVGVIGAIGEVVKFAYLASLAARIPSPELERRANFVRKAYGAVLILMAIVGAAVGVAAVMFMGTGAAGAPAAAKPAAGAAGMPGIFMAGACLLPILFLALLIFMLVALRLQYRLGQEFAKQAAIARFTWAGAQTLRSGLSPATLPPAPPTT